MASNIQSLLGRDDMPTGSVTDVSKERSDCPYIPG
jgi:hypothetical protein